MSKELYEKLEKELSELSDKVANLNHWNHAYEIGKPLVPDSVYDKHFSELKEIFSFLEENKTYFSKAKFNEIENAKQASPLNNIGTISHDDDKFTKVTHQERMYSLTNGYSKDEVAKFIGLLKNEYGENLLFTCELKIDGLAMCLRYDISTGEFIQAVTRGDGVIGENVTHTVKTIENIPKKIDNLKNFQLNSDMTSLFLEVRGEVYLAKDEFNRINSELELDGEDGFMNPRNAAAGSIRQKDGSVAASRKLSFFSYGSSTAMLEQMGFTSYKRALDYFEEQFGFAKNEYRFCSSDTAAIWSYIEKWTEKRAKLPFEIDGVVIKVDDITKYEEIGYTAKAPKWALAYKFPAEEVTTVLNDIVFTVGRTGQVTPNAHFNTIKIAGTHVSKATLHNIDFVKQRDLRIGDTIIVRKAGDIIPEVVKIIHEKRDKTSKPFEMIECCPVCEEPIFQIEGEVAYYCMNPDCEAQLIQKIIHFTSRKAMNIEGFGDKVAEVLFQNGLIHKLSDIYELKYDDLIGLMLNGHSLQAKSVNNLLEAIEKSKENSLERLLFGLGIRHLGEKSAQILAKKYGDFHTLKNTTAEEIASVEGFGSKIATSLMHALESEHMCELIKALENNGVNMRYTGQRHFVNINNFFYAKKVVITGTFTRWKRTELAKILDVLGAKVQGSVSSKTDLVLAGAEAGSKREKAEKLGVVILDETAISNYLEETTYE